METTNIASGVQKSLWKLPIRLLQYGNYQYCVNLLRELMETTNKTLAIWKLPILLQLIKRTYGNYQ